MMVEYKQFPLQANIRPGLERNFIHFCGSNLLGFGRIRWTWHVTSIIKTVSPKPPATLSVAGNPTLTHY
jgi:hypothetical protein